MGKARCWYDGGEVEVLQQDVMAQFLDVVLSETMPLLSWNYIIAGIV